MKFTFTDLKNLYYGYQILGWAEGDMSTIYDADVLFVADTNHIIIAQFECVLDERDVCIGFVTNKSYLNMCCLHTVELMHWLDGGYTIKEFKHCMD